MAIIMAYQQTSSSISTRTCSTAHLSYSIYIIIIIVKYIYTCIESKHTFWLDIGAIEVVFDPISNSQSSEHQQHELCNMYAILDRLRDCFARAYKGRENGEWKELCAKSL